MRERDDVRETEKKQTDADRDRKTRWRRERKKAEVATQGT